jgi:hypothetical protein
VAVVVEEAVDRACGDLVVADAELRCGDAESFDQGRGEPRQERREHLLSCAGVMGATGSRVIGALDQIAHQQLVDEQFDCVADVRR